MDFVYSGSAQFLAATVSAVLSVLMCNSMWYGGILRHLPLSVKDTLKTKGRRLLLPFVLTYE